MGKSHANSGWASDAPTPAQLKEFFAQIGKGRITKSGLQRFLRGGKVTRTVEQWKQEWFYFYRRHFGLELDFSSLKIPEQQPGFERLIIVVQGLTLNQVYDVCAKNFSCWRYADDLDKSITLNDRNPGRDSYAVWFRDRKEADEELKDLSADQLTEKKILGITLLERLLYELKYWDEVDEHLDISNWTLCAGSRNSDGYVPSVIWRSDRLKVSWDDSNSHRDGLRARVAVPCLPKVD